MAWPHPERLVTRNALGVVFLRYHPILARRDAVLPGRLDLHGRCVVGSFVNVVALCTPGGESIGRSSSRCPVCLHRIRWYDNVPLLGWWMLGGRCRDCRTRIPIRYPLVELLAGLLFLTLALGEGLGAGHNLPLPL